MCGCDDGTIIAIQEGRVIQFGQMHTEYVGQFVEDRFGNVWSCGGDGVLLKWSIDNLTESLKNDVKTYEWEVKSLFKRKKDWEVRK